MIVSPIANPAATNPLDESVKLSVVLVTAAILEETERDAPPIAGTAPSNLFLKCVENFKAIVISSYCFKKVR
jgi:hypothetical protein